MTNPVDDWGNPRVDFVYGNMPMQPDDQRLDDNVTIIGPNGDQNRGWSGTEVYLSSALSTTETVYLSVGDQSQDTPWYDIDTREVVIESDNHINAINQYEGFPAFIQGAPYDDIIPNAVVPNIIGMTQAQAETALSNVGLLFNIGSTVTQGATVQNDGKVAQQTTPGTVLNSGDTVEFNLYEYVVTANPIAGMRTLVIPAGWTLNSGEIVMYLLGRTVKPTVSQTIHVEGTGVTDHNQNYQVLQVANDDAFNTGGTAVKLTPLQNGISSTSSNGGTWSVV